MAAFAIGGDVVYDEFGREVFGQSKRFRSNAIFEGNVTIKGALVSGNGQQAVTQLVVANADIKDYVNDNLANVPSLGVPAGMTFNKLLNGTKGTVENAFPRALLAAESDLGSKYYQEDYDMFIANVNAVGVAEENGLVAEVIRPNGLCRVALRSTKLIIPHCYVVGKFGDVLFDNRSFGRQNGGNGVLFVALRDPVTDRELRAEYSYENARYNGNDQLTDAARHRLRLNLWRFVPGTGSVDNVVWDSGDLTAQQWGQFFATTQEYRLPHRTVRDRIVFDNAPITNLTMDENYARLNEFELVLTLNGNTIAMGTRDRTRPDAKIRWHARRVLSEEWFNVFVNQDQAWGRVQPAMGAYVPGTEANTPPGSEASWRRVAFQRLTAGHMGAYGFSEPVLVRFDDGSPLLKDGMFYVTCRAKGWLTFGWATVVVGIDLATYKAKVVAVLQTSRKNALPIDRQNPGYEDTGLFLNETPLTLVYEAHNARWLAFTTALFDRPVIAMGISHANLLQGAHLIKLRKTLKLTGGLDFSQPQNVSPPFLQGHYNNRGPLSVWRPTQLSSDYAVAYARLDGGGGRLVVDRADKDFDNFTHLYTCNNSYLAEDSPSWSQNHDAPHYVKINNSHYIMMAGRFNMPYFRLADEGLPASPEAWPDFTKLGRIASPLTPPPNLLHRNQEWRRAIIVPLPAADPVGATRDDTHAHGTELVWVGIHQTPNENDFNDTWGEIRVYRGPVYKGLEHSKRLFMAP